jgi:hypothetical protein
LFCFLLFLVALKEEEESVKRGSHGGVMFHFLTDSDDLIQEKIGRKNF